MSGRVMHTVIDYYDATEELPAEFSEAIASDLCS